MDSLKLSRSLAYFCVVLAFIVVVLGAYTRLTDAGLGCPDWPGCYGHWMVENAAAPVKAWTEMIHRYAAGTLGLLIFLLTLICLVRRRPSVDFGVLFFLVLILLLVFQAALGRWTVTLQLLPVVVMGHLVGGLTILALLWMLALKQGGHFYSLDNRQQISHDRKFSFWAGLGLCITAAQIILGGWTSANYAALACPDFPTCHGQLWPVHEFKKAFDVFMPLGVNFEGGYLDSAARVTIQVMHRLGALITGVYLLLLSLWLILGAYQKSLKLIAVAVILLVFIQIGLGILNVLMMLPLEIAVLHNAFAALLLLAVVSLNYVIYANAYYQKY